jgi:Transglutaminase-like superfamily
LPCWFLLGIAKALIFTMSFRRLAPRLGVSMGIAPWIPLLSPADEKRALMIGRTVRLAANYTPWDSNCFPQAVTARWLLGLYRIPYALYFGLMRGDDGDELKAHAWVMAGRIRVTGGISFGHFTVVSVFVAPSLAKQPHPASSPP